MDLVRPLSVVTPTLDGDVLARLAAADEAFTPGQLQRLVPRASVDGIRRALNRLAGQGIVDTARAGTTAITYRLNREHVAASAVIELACLWHLVMERLEEELATWGVPATYAAVFGSWARNEAGVESDLDVFLVRPDGAPDDVWDEQVDSLESMATRLTGNDARTLIFTETEVRGHRDEPVLASIVHEGRTVAGDASWLRRTAMRARPA